MPRREERFSPESVLDTLAALDSPARWLVALSGGVDSCALLLAMVRIRDRLEAPLLAIHVNHGWDKDALAWEHHCQALCHRLEVSLIRETVNVEARAQESPEAMLRQLRYAALAKHIGPGDALLTAHHQEDQAETVLLNLLRGSGTDGLAAMPLARPLGRGMLVRPLLDWSRDSLRRFVEAEGTQWIEDPSNSDLRFDRNYLRREIMPLLTARWPAAAASLARSARLHSESRAMLYALADAILARCDQDGEVLDLGGFDPGDAPLFRLVLRRWVERSEGPIPPGARLDEFQRQVALKPKTGTAVMSWADWQVKQWGATLWLVAPGNRPVACPFARWTESNPLALGPEAGQLILDGVGLPGELSVGPYRADERIRIAPNRPGRRIREVLRDAGVPPWLRSAIPVLRDEKRPIAVGDWAVDADFAAWMSQRNARLTWRPHCSLLRIARGRAHAAHLAPRRLVS